MEKILRAWLLLIASIAGLQCQVGGSSSTDPVTSTPSSRIDQDSLSDSLPIEYAKNFSIETYEGHKVAHVHYVSKGRNIRFDQKIVFLREGAPKPRLPAALADAWQVEVPLRTVAANDDGEITRLKTLGLTDNIVAMGGGAIYDPELRQRWEAKQIASIGYSFHRVPQSEVVLDLDPDVLLLYAYDPQKLDGVTKLRQLGVNAVPHFAWAEPTFLGKAEWIKFSALFFDKAEIADEIFARIVSRCTELMELVAHQEAHQEAFLVYHPSDASDWNAHRNDFYALFLEAAGATNVLKDNGPTHAVGMNNEKLLTLAKDADVWIANSTSDKDWPPAKFLRGFKAYRNDRVYHYQKRTRHEHNAYDWYETPEVRPDLVLEDLVSIFYPGLLPEHELLFFSKVKLTKL